MPLSVRKIISKIEAKLARLANKYGPKFDEVLFSEPWNLEVNTIETANYIAENSDKAVYFAVPHRFIANARKLLVDDIKVINRYSPSFLRLFAVSKYFFTAHWKFPKSYNKKQIIVNLWHGIPYKNICKLNGNGGVKADITVATSPLTRKIFSEAFGVPLESVFTSGYPRNDILVRTFKEKKEWKKKLQSNLEDFDKILIWLPTLRRDKVAHHPSHGIPVDNAFQVENFNVEGFNNILKNYNTLCIVKPHPFSVQKEPSNDFSNVLIINDQWLWDQGITLYHLAACTDGLISDVSSIMSDYLLIDNPVICFSSDFEEYKRTRGFVFENIEDWMPSCILKNQEEFFSHLERLLINGEDGYAGKRKKLREVFFSHEDANSTKRLMQHVFNHWNSDSPPQRSVEIVDNVSIR